MPEQRTSNGKKHGYMGVTYDMLSNYEIQDIVSREAQRTSACRAPKIDRTSYVTRVEHSPVATRTATEVNNASPNRFRNPELEAKTAAL